MNFNIDFAKEMQFLSLGEKLKSEMRHCWMNSGRQESVAEHSWRLSLMVMRYAHKLDKPVDMLKCLKMSIVHDFAEAITGDISVIKQNSELVKKQKDQAELVAMLKIKGDLDDQNGNEIFGLWKEYEDQETYESKFVKALDKLEAFIAHNESPLHTWEYVEKEMLFEERYLMKYCCFDGFLVKFAEKVIADGIEKMRVEGEDVEKIKRSTQAKLVNK